MNPFIYRRENGYWCVVFLNRRNRRTKKSLGTKSEKVANRRFREWLQTYDQRKARPRSQRNASLESVGELYIEWVETRKSAGWARRQRRYLNAHIYPFFGADTLIRTISEYEVEAYLSHRVDSGGVKRVTANKELSCLRQLFAFARGKYIDDNPAREIQRLREDDAVPHDRVLTLEEIDKLIEVTDSPLREWIAVAAATGLRTGEQRNLLWDHIDLEQRFIRVLNNPARQHHTKTQAERFVPIVPDLRLALMTMPRHVATDLMFFRPKGGSWINVRKAFAKAVAAAELVPQQREHESDQEYRVRYHREKVTPHTLRHTYTTRLAEAGFDPYTIMGWTGHKTLGTVMGYINVAKTKRSVERLEDIDQITFFSSTPWDKLGTQLVPNRG